MRAVHNGEEGILGGVTLQGVLRGVLYKASSGLPGG